MAGYQVPIPARLQAWVPLWRVTVGVPAVAPPGDGELVRRAATGDAPAFERLVADRADRVFRIARAILGNDSDARDAAQDAFVLAWRQLPRLRDPDTFDAWLRRILVNPGTWRSFSRTSSHRVGDQTGTPTPTAARARRGRVNHQSSTGTVWAATCKQVDWGLAVLQIRSCRC